MTTIKRQTGGDIGVKIRFYGPNPGNGSLGPVFPLTGWTVNVLNPSSQLKNRDELTVVDEAQGIVDLLFEATSDLPAGSHAFGMQLQRATGPTTVWSVGFERTTIQVGSFKEAEFDGEPPFVQVSGKDGLQMTIEPKEPEIIFGAAPAPATDSAFVLEGGDNLLLENGDTLILEAA